MNDISLRQRVEILEEELLRLQRRIDRLDPLEHREVNSPEPRPMEVENLIVVPPPLPSAEPEMIAAQECIEPIEEPAVLECIVPSEIEPMAVADAPVRIQENTELWMGQVWAVRIGVLLLFMGFVFLANYAWTNYISGLSALPRLILLLVISLAGVATGEVLRRKPRLGTFGEVIAAGGLAASYYCAFAVHHIDRLRVIDSPVAGALLLTFTGLAILSYGAWRKAAVMCSIALLMSFFGTCMQPLEVTAMISGIVVAAAGAGLCLHFRWKSVGLVGLLGAYGSFVLWQGLQFQTDAFSVAAWFLCCYWISFNAVILHKNTVWDEKEVVVISSANHGFLAALLPFHWTSYTWDERGWLVYASLGVITLAISFALQNREGRTRLTEAHLIQGIGFLTLASLTKLTGHQLFMVIGVKALLLLAWDRWSARKSVEISGFLLLVISLCSAIFSFAWPISPLVWSLYSLLLLVVLCVMRPDNKQIANDGSMRWLAAFASVGIFGAQVLWKMEGLVGSVWMIFFSCLFSLVDRFLRARFPAKEIVAVAVSAALLSAVGIVFAPQQAAFGVMPCAVVLMFLHAITHHQARCVDSLPSAREVQGYLLSIVAWVMFSVYGVSQLPLGDFSASVALVLLLLIHNYAGHLKWQIFEFITPLFAVAIIAMGYPIFDESNGLYLVHAVILIVYAARLQSAQPEHPMLAVPLLSGATSLCAYLCFHAAHADVYLFLAAVAMTFSARTAITIWRLVCYGWFGVAFLFFCGKPNDLMLSYLFPLLFYAALAYRARIMQLTSNQATRCLALFIATAMALKMSFWVADSGAGYGLSILWAILAAFCFGIGFIIKEPIMRVGMLVLLLLCIFKILLSIWQLGSIMRIVSFFVTGLIFLLLGYVYNKHPEWFGKERSPEN